MSGSTFPPGALGTPHALTHEVGGDDPVTGLPAAAHHVTHEAGGTDVVAIPDPLLIGAIDDVGLNGAVINMAAGGPGFPLQIDCATGGGLTGVQICAFGHPLGFFGGTPAPQPTVAGVLSAVTDANAKAVLTSLIAALAAAGVNLINDGTT